MDIHAMQEAGLTEGEAKVYLALMELGSSTTGPIIEKAHVAKSIIYQLLDKLIQKGDEFFYLGIAPEQPAHFHAYWQRDHLRRAKAGISCKLLFHTDTDPKILKNRNSYKLCDSRYMPTAINTPAWIMGYKEVTVIGFPSVNPITLEIVNKEIADSFKAYFDAFWKQSKPFK